MKQTYKLIIAILLIGMCVSVANATPSNTSIIGFRWNTSSDSPILSQVNSAGTVVTVPATFWDDSVIWGNMKTVVVASNGTIFYGTNNRGDGLDLNGTQGDVLVEIPKFWTCSTYSAPYFYYYISPVATPGYEVAPMFNQRMPSGVITPAPYFYVARYDASDGGSSKLQSATGKTPLVSQTIGTFRTYATNKGSGWGITNIWTLSAIRQLFYTEMLTLNSQAAWVGSRGVVDDTGSSVGARSSGSNNINTAIYANNATGNGTGLNGWTPVEYRGMESLWGNIWQFQDGFNAIQGTTNIVNKTGFNSTNGRTTFQDLMFSTDVTTVGTLVISDGYQSNLINTDVARGLFLPSSVTGGGETKYLADYYYYPSSTNANAPNILLSGGAWDAAGGAGVGALVASGAASTSSAAFGARLEFRPSIPTVSFSATPSIGVNPLTVSFNDTTTSGSTITSYNASFGDGLWRNDTTFPPTNITHLYSTAGNYTVNWYVSNAAGTGSANTTISVLNNLIANFTQIPSGGSAPLLVSFTDTSTNATAIIDSWSWIFGDKGVGNTSGLQNPTHTYTAAGTYTANLTIRNTSYDLTSTHLATIYANATVVADFAASPTSGYATLPVSFVDMSSPSDVFSWAWNFGDGSTSTSRNPTHSYTTPGSYNVSLTATNPDGSNTNTKLNYIVVSQSADINPDSTLKFKSDLNIISNQTRYNRTVQISNVTSANWVNASILFNASTIFVTNIFVNKTSYSDNTLVSSTIDNVGGSITFNVTKPSAYNPGSSSASIVDIELFQKVYAMGNTSTPWNGGVLGNSTYNTTHPVTYFEDSLLYYGAWKTYSNFTISKFYPIIGTDAVTFTPLPPSGYTANRWLWNFGDGNSFLDLNGTSVSHMYTTYISNATLYPSLTAYLNENVSVTNTTTLTISPVYANDYIVANFSGSPTSGSSGLLVTFTDLSMIGNRTNLVYNWSFGDGTYSSDLVNVLHVYSSVGIYTVKLTVTNDYGTSTETKANYIVISNQQTTTFYIPKTASFHVIDVYGNQIGGATLSATYNGSTLPDTTISWLVSNYGMNTITSGEATDGALSMSGTTSDTGDLTFVMIAPLEYDMYITYGGVTNHFFITTGSSNYQLRFVVPVATNTGLSACVYANGNTHTGISSPDPYNMTFMWSYQDTCGLTTAIDYIVNDVDLGTNVYNYHLTPVTSGIYVNNYTVSNVRGKNYIWYENATRSV